MLGAEHLPRAGKPPAHGALSCPEDHPRMGEFSELIIQAVSALHACVNSSLCVKTPFLLGCQVGGHCLSRSVTC